MYLFDVMIIGKDGNSLKQLTCNGYELINDGKSISFENYNENQCSRYLNVHFENGKIIQSNNVKTYEVDCDKEIPETEIAKYIIKTLTENLCTDRHKVGLEINHYVGSVSFRIIK